MNVKSKAGFSLVELMVVVAIIGVLATVAVPNYMKFQAKAKQSNAKSELAGIYTSQKAFFVEYSIFSSSLPMAGYVPEGYPQCAAVPATPGAGQPSRLYSVGMAAGGVVPAGASDPCGTAVGAAVVAADGTTAFWANNSTVAARVIRAAPTGTAIDNGVAIPTFTAAAEGQIGGAASDRWTINNNNTIVNTQTGI